MKRLVKQQMRRALIKGAEYVANSPTVRMQQRAAASVVQTSQLQLAQHYRQLGAQGLALPSFADVEFSCYSQNGEDGILLYILALIGFGERRSVEIGVQDGTECNTANLLLNHGFTGLLVDAEADHVARGQAFYRKQRATWQWPPKFIQAWITQENVNRTLINAGFTGQVDVFSLDIDGMDYWIWDALTAIEPRVVVVECNDAWPADRAVAIPYQPDFAATFVGGMPEGAGASLAAFVKLAQRKGYRLVGCQQYGYNAFFVRDGISEDLLPSVNPAALLNHPKALAGRDRLLSGQQAGAWGDV